MIFALAACSKDEAHRAAILLEVKFDLARIIATPAAADEPNHHIFEHHVLKGMSDLLDDLFMIWQSFIVWFAAQPVGPDRRALLLPRLPLSPVRPASHPRGTDAAGPR